MKTFKTGLLVIVFCLLPGCGDPVVGSADGGKGGGTASSCGAADGGTAGGGAGGGTAGGGAGGGTAGGSGGGTAGGSGGGSNQGLPPTVTSTSPLGNAVNVALNATIAATFSAVMNSTTLNNTTFTVTAGAGATPLNGTVVYAGSTATFNPTANLSPGTNFTATLTTGVKDLAGNALAAAYSWSFATGALTAKGPAPVDLGTAGNFVVLAKAGVSTVPSSTLTGNLGVSPAAATYITGFSLIADATNVFSTSPQVVGKVYAANYAVPTPSNLTTAIGNMESAYDDAAGRPTPDFLELGTGNIGGLTLVPGLFKWTSTVTIPTDVTLSGGANDVWIFQTTGNITMAAAKKVMLIGGAQAKNIFWQVAGEVTLGAGAHFEGIILSKTGITLQTGATMNGRALAQTQIALQQATITQP